MADPGSHADARLGADRARRVQGLAAVLILLALALALRAAWLGRRASDPDVLVEVGGAVERPGLQAFAPGAAVRDVLAAARPKVPLAADPFLGLAVADGDHLELLEDGTVHVESPREAVLLGRPVDVNAADGEMLTTVPGLGPSTAVAIVADREAHGPFPSVDALVRVRGVGPATLARIRPLVVAVGIPGHPTVATPASETQARGAASTRAGPVDLNTASAALLDTLPGIGPARAAAIVEDRTRRGPFRAVADLDRVPGIGPATLARVAHHATVVALPGPENP